MALLLFLSVGPALAQETTPQPVLTALNAGSIELSVYVVIVGLLVAFAVMTLKLWAGLGIIGGLLGAIFAYFTLTSQNLITNTLYDFEVHTWVHTYTPIGFLAYVPLLLCALNLVLVVKSKK